MLSPTHQAEMIVRTTNGRLCLKRKKFDNLNEPTRNALAILPTNGNLQRQGKISIKRPTKKADLLSDEPVVNPVKLTDERVKAALSSLVPKKNPILTSKSPLSIGKRQHDQNPTLTSRKRRRNKSICRQTSENKKKKLTNLYDAIIPLSNITTTTQSETIVLATSNLTSQQMKQIKQFVELFNCRLSTMSTVDNKPSFDQTLTHLITDEIGSNDSLVCTLSKTVVFAIAQHCFVLSYRWILECIHQNMIVDEDRFEIEGDDMISTKHNGPRRSRLTKRPLLPSNHFIMIKGNSRHVLNLTNNELGDLAWLAGGIHIEQNRFPNTIFARQCFLLIEDEDIRNKNMFHRCVDKGLKFLKPEWLVHSIVDYRMASIVQYHCDPFDTIDLSE